MKTSLIVVLAAATIAGLNGCASYNPATGGGEKMTVAQARHVIGSTHIWQSLEWSPVRIEVGRDSVQLFYSRGKPETCRFDQITRVEQHGGGEAMLRGCPSSHHEYPFIRCRSNSECRRMVNAFHVLKSDYDQRQAAETAQQQAAFETVVKQYRATQPRPSLPPSAMRFKAQAEFAVHQKRFEDAVNLYGEALNAAPWWPQGYYNRGLLLAELKAYVEAIRDFQKYLKLEPQAANAQAVQTSIYQWESLVPKR